MAITYASVETALLENADFEETASLTKAKAFVTACNRFFVLMPASQGDQGTSMAMGLPQIQALMARAQSYIKANDSANNSTSHVRFLTFADGFRG